MTARTRIVVRAALVALAGAATLTPAWPPLRTLFVLPVLVLVAGWSATDLLLGRRRAPDDEDGLRRLLPVVLGFLMLFAVPALLVAGHARLTADRVTPTALALTTLLLVAATPWRAVLSGGRDAPDDAGSRPPEPRTTERRTAVLHAAARRARPVLAVTGAVLALGTAVGGAVAMQPVPVEHVTRLDLDDPGALRGTPLIARPGAPVDLDWRLTSTDDDGAPAAPDVRLTVGDERVTAVTASGSDGSGRRTTTFSAPRRGGLYRVELLVGPDPTSGDRHLAVTAVLQVTP